MKLVRPSELFGRGMYDEVFVVLDMLRGRDMLRGMKVGPTAFEGLMSTK